MESARTQATAKAVNDMLEQYVAGGGTIASAAADTGVNRAQISGLRNSGGGSISQDKLDRLHAWLTRQGYAPRADESDAADAETPVRADETKRGTAEIPIYPTEDYKALTMWLDEAHECRAIAALIGSPRTGKTTLLKSYCRAHAYAHYIECWSSMHVGGLLDAIADAAGVRLTGRIHEREMQLLRALQDGGDMMLLFDEAEHLEKSTIEKLEILRKIWDNAGVAIVLAGTEELERVLTRGSGAANRAQLYGRMWGAKTTGMKRTEALKMMESYDIDADAAAMLAVIAEDARHGGIGVYVETLKLAMRIARGGRITADIVRNAKGYKLMYGRG